MIPSLFDINFLLALAWPNHQFHSIANTWFEKQASHGWATCAVTQLGFIRLSSNPSYLKEAKKTPEEARQYLKSLLEHQKHRFLVDLDAPVHFPEIASIVGHQQLTDAYLVGLARLTGTRLVTFDKHPAALAINKKYVEVLAPMV